MKKGKVKYLLTQAKKELREFKKSKPRYSDWNVHLVQASEKIWSAYILMLEELSRTEIEYSDEIWEIKNKLRKKIGKLDELHTNARLLHIYHYEGRTPNKEIYEICRETIRMIEIILKERG